MNIDLLTQKTLFEKYNQKAVKWLSVFSFVHIFTWQKFFQFKFEVIDDALCIFAQNMVGTFMYLPPLNGQLRESTITQCWERLRAMNKNSGVSRIENLPQLMAEQMTDSPYEIYRKGYDYCYFRRDLVELKGNDFKSKRQTYNHFVKHHAAQLADYEPAMLEECLALYNDWANKRKAAHEEDIYQHMLDENRSVHSLAMQHYRELGLVGKVVKIDGKIKAYAFGYPLNSRMFCILMEVADLAYKGLPVFIFKDFCDAPELRPFDFINVMDDFEMKSVEWTKLSFRPAMLVPSYILSERKESHD